MFLAFDLWGWLGWLGLAVGALVVFFVLQLVYLSVIFVWGDRRTTGLAYYGLPPAERERFKRLLRRHGVLLFPILRVLGRTSRFTFQNASFVHDGVAGPKGTCSADSFRRAVEYRPRPEDVFVATQMKCGTTWMQHVVYEVLHRGGGDLVETGTALYAVSPWIEAQKSVSVDEAPLLGVERPSRVIKTHLPARICPYGDGARYVYVVRHPVSCFASCVDFIATNIGAFAPPLRVVEEWFCSDELMWWGSWPQHVAGWWEWSKRPSVLFVAFEDMKRDLRAQVVAVADFLGIEPLTESELDAVVHKCGFAYMKEHAEAFEMHPPHILQTDAELFVSGKAERHQDVPADVRQRVLEWCRTELQGGDFPLGRYYPDVARGELGG